MKRTSTRLIVVDHRAILLAVLAFAAIVGFLGFSRESSTKDVATQPTALGRLAYDRTDFTTSGFGYIAIASSNSDGTGTETPARSVVSTAGLTYSYDLGWQDDSAIEVNFQGYDQRYFERSEFDLGIYQLDVGPRFRLDGALSALAVRPYVAGALLTLEELRYLTQGAAGLNIRHDISSTFGLEYYGQAGHRHYTNSDRRTTASDSTGAEYQGGVTMRARVDDTQLASLLLRGTRTTAEKQSQSQQIIQFGGSYTVDLGSAVTPMERPVVVTLSGLYSSVHYDAADPTIDPTIRRHDHRLDGRLITSVGLTDWLSFVFTGELTRNYSSLPNFQYNNSGVSASFAASF